MTNALKIADVFVREFGAYNGRLFLKEGQDGYAAQSAKHIARVVAGLLLGGAFLI